MTEGFAALIEPILEFSDLTKCVRLPLAGETGKAGLDGEELLHGGLFEVALLGDELVELGKQGIHIRQCNGDGALFSFGLWPRQAQPLKS